MSGTRPLERLFAILLQTGERTSWSPWAAVLEDELSGGSLSEESAEDNMEEWEGMEKES